MLRNAIAALIGGICGAAIGTLLSMLAFPAAPGPADVSFASLTSLGAVSNYTFASVIYVPGALLATWILERMHSGQGAWPATRGWLIAMGTSAVALALNGLAIWHTIAHFALGSALEGFGWLSVALNIAAAVAMVWFIDRAWCWVRNKESDDRI
ncbi:MAG: hypothetical protein HZC37_09355 [Burkholderiales bacterium]|nr:hypothetical protein [Burkholderiales bacterium]